MTPPVIPASGKPGGDTSATPTAFPASRRDVLLLFAIAGFAFLLRLVPYALAGGLFSATAYDDGVYFSAAVAFVHGVVPYRDFLLLHPPGIVYLLTPFAALGGVVGDANAYAAARVAFMALGAVNTLLVGLVAGRQGRVAAIAAALLYAVLPGALMVERTPYLIGPQNTMLLLALLLLVGGPGRARLAGLPGVRRSAAAGALLGVAFALQVWAVVPAGVLFLWLALVHWRSDARSLAPAFAFAAGAMIAGALLWLPFLVLSGGAMLRYTILDQLGRTNKHLSPMVSLRNVLGLSKGRHFTRVLPGAFIAAFAVGVSLLVAWSARVRPANRLWVALLAVQVIFVMRAPPLVHYAAWLGPAAALALGGAVDALLGPGRMPWVRRLAVGAIGMAMVLFLVQGVVPAETPATPSAALRAAVAGKACVRTDLPALLLETDLLTPQLERGCTFQPDVTGASYDHEVLGAHVPRVKQPAYQLEIAAYLSGGDALMLGRTDQDMLSKAAWATIRAAFPVEQTIGPVLVLTRP